MMRNGCCLVCTIPARGYCLLGAINTAENHIGECRGLSPLYYLYITVILAIPEYTVNAKFVMY